MTDSNETLAYEYGRDAGYADGYDAGIREFAEELLESRLGVIVVKDHTDEYARGYFDAIEFVDGKVKELVAEMVGEKK